MPYSSTTGPVGSRSFINRSSSVLSGNDIAEAGTVDNLIGRKVWTRWPEDNNFYEAVISDYNPIEVHWNTQITLSSFEVNISHCI